MIALELRGGAAVTRTHIRHRTIWPRSIIWAVLSATVQLLQLPEIATLERVFR